MGGYTDWAELSAEKDDLGSEGWNQQRAKLLNEVGALLKQGDWKQAQSRYEQMSVGFGWTGELRDRAEICARLAAQPTPPGAAFLKALTAYFAGLDQLEGEALAEAGTTFDTVAADPGAGFLKEYALYQQASVAYAWLDFSHALTLYQQFLAVAPQSPKREAALLMLARCALLPQTADGPKAEIGKQALAQLRKEFPHTRYAAAIQGLQGRVYLLSGNYPEALRCYFAAGDMESVQRVAAHLPEAESKALQARILEGHLRRLMTVRIFDRYEQSIGEIRVRLAQLSKSENSRFSQDLLAEPELAASYLYYRLYHCDNKPEDWKHLGQFADSLIAHNPSAHLSPSVLVRLAEVSYQRKEYDRALEWAARALAAAPKYDRALFVHGAIQHKRHSYAAALSDFNALMQNCPGSPLTHGAREELAILDELTGEMGGALDQYIALQYQPDIAYLLDAKMTISQVEAYYRATPETAQISPARFWRSGETSRTYYPTRDLLAYTLGMRYLREEQWDQAETWFKRVNADKRAEFDKGRNVEDYSHDKITVVDALTVARQLRDLKQAIEKAGSDNARAEALYAYASYYYTHGTLLLYNGALWQGGRAFNFGMFWSEHQPTPADKEVAKQHAYSHEVYNRCYDLCLQVAERYPQSPAAPKALYRAACASRRLANFNGWWRDDNKQHNHWEDAARLMRDLARRYPRDPLVHDAKKYADVFAQEKKDYQW